MNWSLGHKINLGLFVLTLVLNLTIPNNHELWKNFGDPYDYLHQSEQSLSSLDFYAPEKTAHYARPFTVPLFYKIVGSNPDAIVWMQKVLHTFAAFFFSLAMLQFFKTKRASITFLILFYLFMSWWSIIGWTNMILSESISNSLLIIWLGSILFFIKKKSVWWLVAHVILTILFSFTRDSWPYIICLFYSIAAVSSWKLLRTHFWKFAGLFGFGLILFFVQQKTAEIGQRYRLPITNNIMYRIIPNEDYFEWFQHQGMPDAELLAEKQSHLNHWKDIYPLYDDPELDNFYVWVVQDGRSTYSKFLLTHPSMLLLRDEKQVDLNKIFAHNFGYIGRVDGYSRFAQNIFPIFRWWLTIPIVLLVIWFYFRTKRKIFLFPVLLTLLFAANAYLIFLADCLEHERHLFITTLMMQVIGILSVALIMDSKEFSNLLDRFKRVR